MYVRTREAFITADFIVTSGRPYVKHRGYNGFEIALFMEPSSAQESC